MELSGEAFLDSVKNPNTKKEYRHGIKRSCDWFGKSAEEILQLRKSDLTQMAGEGLIEYARVNLFSYVLSLPIPFLAFIHISTLLLA